MEGLQVPGRLFALRRPLLVDRGHKEDFDAGLCFVPQGFEVNVGVVGNNSEFLEVLGEQQRKKHIPVICQFSTFLSLSR